MISAKTQSYLRGRVSTAKTWEEIRKEEEAKKLAEATRAALLEFSDRLHSYALTQEGQARAQELRDREYDDAIAAYQKGSFL